MGYYWDPDKVEASDGTLLIDLSNDNKVQTPTGNQENTTAIGELGHDEGKYYCEMKVLEHADYTDVGIGTQDLTCEDEITKTTEGWAWMSDARKWHDGSQSGTDIGWGHNDILQVAVDLDAGKVWFGRNGTWVDSGDPENGDNATFTDSDISNNTIFPAFGNYDLDNSNNETQLFLTSVEFSYSPPSGFSAWKGLAKVEGTVTENDEGVSRTVRAYLRGTGELAGETESDSNGAFSIGGLKTEEHYVVALDDISDDTDYNALIYDRIVPKEEE